jgi:hypothetical protein
VPISPEAPSQAAQQAQAVADVRADLIREQTIARRMKNAQEAGALVPFEEFAARLAKFAPCTRSSGPMPNAWQRSAIRASSWLCSKLKLTPPIPSSPPTR